MQSKELLQKKHTSSTKERFSSGFRWSIAGSITFEASHIIHNTCLLYLMGYLSIAMLPSSAAA